MCLAVESFWDVIGAEPAQVFADILAFYLCYIDWLPFFQTSIEKILIRLERLIEDATANLAITKLVIALLKGWVHNELRFMVWTSFLILVSTTVRKVKQKP